MPGHEETYHYLIRFDYLCPFFGLSSTEPLHWKRFDANKLIDYCDFVEVLIIFLMIDTSAALFRLQKASPFFFPSRPFDSIIRTYDSLSLSL